METRKILIVDDDVDLCDSLKAILESAGYAATTASSRAEGMAKMKAERPDLLVLDVMMETWHDGFEMSRELKKDQELCHTPILMLTSVEERTGVQVKSSAGDPDWLPVDGFLDKPVEPDTLLVEIEKLLESAKA
jgi:CheY-like chemotaxis protein